LIFEVNKAVASGTFEQTSLDWQLQQLQQRVGEWIERLFSPHWRDHPTNWNLPVWFLQGCFWLIVTSLVGWAGWQLYQLLSPYFYSWKPGLQPASTGAAESTELSAEQWLRRSRSAQQQRNYREACRVLYLAMLQHLNDRELIRQQASRTDGEYLSLVQTLTPSQPYQILIRTHERLCFDQTAISAETFDRCWQAYQEISRT
jgi:hypothetical protein